MCDVSGGEFYNTTSEACEQCPQSHFFDDETGACLQCEREDYFMSNGECVYCNVSESYSIVVFFYFPNRESRCPKRASDKNLQILEKCPNFDYEYLLI